MQENIAYVSKKSDSHDHVANAHVWQDHYKFKGDPDTSVVPEYGSASVHSGEGYY